MNRSQSGAIARTFLAAAPSRAGSSRDGCNIAAIARPEKIAVAIRPSYSSTDERRLRLVDGRQQCLLVSRARRVDDQAMNAEVREAHRRVAVEDRTIAAPLRRGRDADLEILEASPRLFAG